MKGLLRNNWYTLLPNLKVFSVVIVLLGIFAVLVISPLLLIGYVLLIIIGFSVISCSGLSREYSSKWNKYKLTTPVKRADIVKSYFISQALWLAIGICFAGTALAASFALHGFLFNTVWDYLKVLTIGISITLFFNAIFFPLHFVSGSDRNEVFLFISLLCSMGIVTGLSCLINWIFGIPMPTWQMLLGMSLIVLCSIICFIASLSLTQLIFKKKDY